MITIPTRAPQAPAESGPEPPDQHWLLMAMTTMRDLGRLTAEPYGGKSWPGGDPIERPAGETQDQNIRKPDTLNPFKEPEVEDPRMGGGPISEQVADRGVVERDLRLPEDLDIGHPRGERKDFSGKFWTKWRDINRRIHNPDKGETVTEDERLYWERQKAQTYKQLVPQEAQGRDKREWAPSVIEDYDALQRKLQHTPMSSGPSAATEFSAQSRQRQPAEDQGRLRQLQMMKDTNNTLTPEQQQEYETLKGPRPSAPPKTPATAKMKPQGWLDWMKGNPKEEDLSEAPPLSQYATKEDVAFAKQYGFYEDLHEPWTTGQVASVVKQWRGRLHSEIADERLAETIRDNPVAGEIFAKAALVSNRIPLASLGFDPSRTNLILEDADPNMLGGYSPKKDRMYGFGLKDPSVVVHESIHRGVQKLRDKYPEKMKDIEGRLPAAGFTQGMDKDETLTRWIMASQAGDPETNPEGGRAGQKQVSAAKWLYGESMHSREYVKTLNELNELAVQELGERRRSRGHQ